MNYNSLQVSARKRYSSGLEFQASYTLSRTLTDNLGYYGSSGVAAEGANWQNAYNRDGDYDRAFFDALHNFGIGGTYWLPYGRDRHFGKSELCQDPGAIIDPASGKPSSYAVPALNTFGTSSKATEQAPDFKDLNFSAGKQFHTTEKQYFDLRADS